MFKEILEMMNYKTNPKVLAFAKKAPKEQFLELSKQGKIGGKSISEMIGYIEGNSSNKLNLKDVRKVLNDAGKTGRFYLYEVDSKKLVIQDKEIVNKENTERNIKKEIKPIVINNEYWVIDGRHRAASAKGKILAYVPAELFYDLANS